MLPREHYLKQAFQDPQNFPDGFEAGGLSSIQARLIRKHGVLINALIDDNVSDANSEDLHLLKVIANQGSPKTPVEQAWVKYLSLIKAKQSNRTGKSTKPSSKTGSAKSPTSAA